jgi:hypothetical protein
MIDFSPQRLARTEVESAKTSGADNEKWQFRPTINLWSAFFDSLSL